MNNTLVKIATASTSALVVNEAVSLEPLYSALITLAISIVSCLAVEFVGWLKAYFVRKAKENESKTKEIEEKTKDKED